MRIPPEEGEVHLKKEKSTLRTRSQPEEGEVHLKNEKST